MDIEQAKKILAAYLVGKQVSFDEVEEARQVAAGDADYVQFLEEAFAAEPAPAEPKPAVSWLPLVKAARGVRLDRDMLQEVLSEFQVLFGMPDPGTLPVIRVRGGPPGVPIENAVMVEKQLDEARLRLRVAQEADRVEVQVSGVQWPEVEYLKVELRDAVTAHLLQETLLNKECPASQPFPVPADAAKIHVNVAWPGRAHRLEITLREEGR